MASCLRTDWQSARLRRCRFDWCSSVSSPVSSVSVEATSRCTSAGSCGSVRSVTCHKRFYDKLIEIFNR